MKVYFISGLAADNRVFRHIELPPHYEAIHLDWIPPQKNESLSSYALRLAEGIDRSEKFVLIGLSFGGMIAAEIARNTEPVETILISSIPVSGHLPWYFRAAGFVGLDKIVPISLLKSAALAKRLFTTETDEDKDMLRIMIKDCDVQFVRWALRAIITWKNDKVPARLVHVHGTRDEILPRRFTKPTHVIRGAGHLMVMNRAGEINSILQQALVFSA